MSIIRSINGNPIGTGKGTVNIESMDSEIASLLYKKGETLTVYTFSDGHKLNSSGLSVADQAYRIDKYAVSAGTAYFLNLSGDGEVTYQWQSSEPIPSSGINRYLIDDPVAGDVNACTIAPSGATYLIVSRYAGTSLNTVADGIPLSESVRDNVVKPRMANGNIGNSGNANFVRTQVVLPVFDATRILVASDITLPEGGHFEWQLGLYDNPSYIGGSPQNTRTFTYVPASIADTFEIPCDGSFVGFSIAVGVVDANGEYVPLRISSVGKCVTLTYVRNSRVENDALEWLATPFLRNGTARNTANANFVGLHWSIPTNGASGVTLHYNGPLSSGQRPLWQVEAFSVERSIASSTENVVFYDDATGAVYSRKYGQDFFLPLDSEVKSIYAAVTVANQDGTVESLRVAANAECIQFKFSYGKRLSENIVTRNEDVFPAVLASSKYGHNGSGIKNVSKMLSILVCTDVHKSTRQMKNVIAYLNEVESIDAGICLGDMALANFTETDGSWYTDAVNSSMKPFYTIIGNHDGGNSASASISGSKDDVFAKWIEPTLGIMGMESLEKTYYSKRFSSYNVTCVMIDNYDVPDTVVSGGDFAVSRGVEAISQGQIDWLVSTLSSVPSDDTLVIFRHSAGSQNFTIDSNAVFTSKLATDTGGSSWGYESDVVSMVVDAWIGGTSLSASVPPKSAYSGLLPTLTVSADFSSRGNGKFACYVVGHSHRDTIARESTYGHLCIVLDTTANDNYQNYWSDLPRTINTKAEDCITVVSFDTDNDRINLVRIGSNVTMDMRYRTIESIPFIEE